MSNENSKMKAMSEAKCIKIDKCFHKIPIIIIRCLGSLMANIDEIAAITAMKHAGAQVVTASTDSVDFLRPIKTGDILSYEAMVSYAGTSSMEICVQIIIDDVFNNERHLAALSF